MATQTTDTLTKTTDELQGLWRESQEAATTAWQRWAESVQSFTPASFAPWNVSGQLPSPQQSVDAAFDLAEQVLQTQRRFLHEWIDATRPVVETAQRQTGEVARQAEQTAQTTARTAQNTARKAQAEAKAANTPDYASMTVEELQDHAAKADIEGRSSMNKDQLVKALSKR